MYMKYLYFLYPVMGGLFGFLATIVGSHFFSTDNEYLYIAVGILLFLGCNNMLYKFNFNSYAKNGPTITTSLVFVSQTICMAIYKRSSINIKWIVGVCLMLVGTVLLESGK